MLFKFIGTNCCHFFPSAKLSSITSLIIASVLQLYRLILAPVVLICSSDEPIILRLDVSLTVLYLYHLLIILIFFLSFFSLWGFSKSVPSIINLIFLNVYSVIYYFQCWLRFWCYIFSLLHPSVLVAFGCGFMEIVCVCIHWGCQIDFQNYFFLSSSSR